MKDLYENRDKDKWAEEDAQKQQNYEDSVRMSFNSLCGGGPRVLHRNVYFGNEECEVKENDGRKPENHIDAPALDGRGRSHAEKA